MAREFVDATDLDGLRRVLGRMPDEAKKEVRKVNRAAAAVLRKRIRPELPRTGGSSKGKGARLRRKSAIKKAGSKHNTKVGAMRNSVKSHSALDYAGVRADPRIAPHFVVQEFGGAVWWEKGAMGGRGSAPRRNHKSVASQRAAFGGSRGHIIPVRDRSPNVPAKSPLKGTFPSGWFFFRTAAQYMPQVVYDHAQAMQELTRHMFGRI